MNTLYSDGLHGSCHCGGVRFRIDRRPDEMTICDCSLCTMRNALMIKMPDASLQIVEGEDLLTLYEWNTKRAKHFFCGRCGIYVFHRKRAAPDHFGVNVFCLEEFDRSSVPIRATDGAGMSVTVTEANRGRRGPRTQCQEQS